MCWFVIFLFIHNVFGEMGSYVWITTGGDRLIEDNKMYESSTYKYYFYNGEDVTFTCTKNSAQGELRWIFDASSLVSQVAKEVISDSAYSIKLNLKLSENHDNTNIDCILEHDEINTSNPYASVILYFSKTLDTHNIAARAEDQGFDNSQFFIGGLPKILRWENLYSYGKKAIYEFENEETLKLRCHKFFKNNYIYEGVMWVDDGVQSELQNHIYVHGDQQMFESNRTINLTPESDKRKLRCELKQKKPPSLTLDLEFLYKPPPTTTSQPTEPTFVWDLNKNVTLKSESLIQNKKQKEINKKEYHVTNNINFEVKMEDKTWTCHTDTSVKLLVDDSKLTVNIKSCNQIIFHWCEIKEEKIFDGGFKDSKTNYDCAGGGVLNTITAQVHVKKYMEGLWQCSFLTQHNPPKFLKNHVIYSNRTYLGTSCEFNVTVVPQSTQAPPTTSFPLSTTSTTTTSTTTTSTTTTSPTKTSPTTTPTTTTSPTTTPTTTMSPTTTPMTTTSPTTTPTTTTSPITTSPTTTSTTTKSDSTETAVTIPSSNSILEPTMPPTTNNPESQTGEPFPIKWIIVSGLAALSIIIFMIIIVVAVRSNRKKKLKMRNRSYDNLNNDSQFPPNLEPNYANPRDARLAATAGSSDLYSVPYSDTEKLYAKPIPKSQRQIPEVQYTEVTTGKFPLYAEVGAKLNKKKDSTPIYSEVVINKGATYDNVFEKSGYVNTNVSEYAEPAYCEVKRF